MIGLFARMVPSKDAVTEVEVAEKEWRTRGADGSDKTVKDPDAPPAPFTQTIEYEGGSVVVSPLLEALRLMFQAKGR